MPPAHAKAKTEEQQDEMGAIDIFWANQHKEKDEQE